MIKSIIVAMDINNGIGLNNQLPWHISEDLKYFKEKTWNKTILVGRNTYDSLFNITKGKMLPNRNICTLSNTLTNTNNYNNIESFFYDYEDNDEVFIAGGSMLYKKTIDIVDKMYITKIFHKYECDCFFPNFNIGDWNILKDVQILTKNNINIKFIELRSSKLSSYEKR